MSLSIKLPNHVYAGLLAEAKRRDTTVPALTREVLAIAAHLFDNEENLPGMGKHGENNNERSIKN
ncbi:hypothetical protein ACQEL9_004406 [Raoultella planticola]